MNSTTDDAGSSAASVGCEMAESSSSSTSDQGVPQESSSSAAPIDTPALSLTKAEKGRLKKLRRRAALQPDDKSSGGTVTGIVTRSDFVELSDLQQQQARGDQQTKGQQQLPLALGPTVLVSNRPAYVEDEYTNPDKWQHTSGADHRDIIMSLLFHDGSSDQDAGDGSNQKQSNKKHGKRKHEGGNGGGVCPSVSVAASAGGQAKRFAPAALPSWARIHNPACATALVVVEFSIESSIAGEVMPSRRVASSASAAESNDTRPTNVISELLSQEGHCGRRAVPFSTRLFQGDRIRTSTDVLMYSDIPDQEQQQNVNGNAKGESSAMDSNNASMKSHDISTIASLLQPLVLKRKSRRKERYPCQVIPKKKGTPPKKKKYKKSEVEIAEEEKEANRSVAKERVAEISDKLPSVLESLATGNEASHNGGELFSKAFSRCEAIELVKKLEVSVLGQEQEYANGEVFIPTFLPASNGLSEAAATATTVPQTAPSIFAVDCEMVETSAGRELARVTLLRFEPKQRDRDGYKVVLDVLVKPARPVRDYLTQYSGITAKMLNSVTTRLEEVQIVIAATIKAGDILIGHSLENDLRALCLVHDKVVDTALLFRTNNGSRKHSLKHLSAVLLKRRIQAGCGSSGHCSEEDAAAALLLALNRARIGESFKLYERSEPKNIVEEVTAARRNNLSSARGGATSVAGVEAPIVVLGPDDWLKRHVRPSKSAAHALTCESIGSATSGALVAWLASETRKANLLWANLTVDIDDSENAATHIDDVMTGVLRQAQGSAAVLFIFQAGFQQALSLTRQRKAASDSRSTLGWSLEQEEQWRRAVDSCSTSEALWIGMCS